LRDSQNKSKNRRKKKEEEQNLFDLVFIWKQNNNIQVKWMNSEREREKERETPLIGLIHNLI
jgi:hypothetical protein